MLPGMTSAARRDVVYVRISDDRTGQEAGITRQDEDARALVKPRGWNVVETIADNDLSATSGKRRPGYERLCKLLKDGAITGVAVYHQDRLYRRAGDLERFINLVDASGVEIASVKAGDVDLSTPDGRMFARITCAVSQRFVENMTLDVKRANKGKAEAGVARSNAPRFGYVTGEDGSCTWEIHKAQAKAIRDAAKHVLAGGTMRALERQWKTEGYLTPFGNPYAAQSLRRLLMRPYLAGLMVHQDVVIGKGNWKPILDEATHEQLCLVLTGPDRQRQGPPKKFPFAGRIYCGKCHNKLHGGPKAGHPSYQCKKTPSTPDACEGISVRAADVEPYVVEQVTFRMVIRNVPPRVTIKNRGEAHDPAKTLAVLKAKRSLREEAEEGRYVRGDLKPVAYKRIVTQLDGEIATLEQQLAANAGQGDSGWIAEFWESMEGVGSGAAFRMAWDAADVDGRRRMMASVVQWVRILPASRKGAKFDGKERVKIKYTF